MGDADDRTLAGRATDGDVRAFEVLVRRHGPLMRAYATRVLGSNAESDDVVQEAFIAAWRQLPDLEELGGVKGWLMRIVSNKSIDRVRARRNHLDVTEYDPEAPAAQSPARVAEAHSATDALSAALAGLPEGQRRCWLLKEVAGYSYDGIAAELEIPVSTVRGLLARARKSLMQEMEAWR
ncbi:MAG: RNA polymerase sigma factor [Burkholderiaceae bacterium]|nr:RNA polymerase sigma factor [Microbacteriaceae bacterium]